MPFASNKTKEQLTFESKTKSATMLGRSIGFMEKVARKRDTPPEVKKRLKEIIEEDLVHLQKLVGPT